MGKDAYSDSKTQTSSRAQTRLPAQFRVLMHNDDYTTMEFVVEVLEQVFRKSSTEANLIMLQIHHKGQGMCGVYPFEVAETKVEQVHERARYAGFPLRCSLEQA